MSNEEKILAMLETMNKRFDRIEARLDKVEADTHWTRIKIESDIDKKVQLLLEGHSLLAETTARKEQIEELREELGLERYRIDVLSEQRKAN